MTSSATTSPRLASNDEGVTPVRVGGGVARLAEAVQDMLDGEGGSADRGDGAELGVRDHGHRPDGLDAARFRQRAHVPEHPTTRELDGDEPRFFIGGHERDLPLRGERSRRQDERRCSDDEGTAVHPP